MICYKSIVKLPVHAMELGAVHAINVVFQKKLERTVAHVTS